MKNDGKADILGEIVKIKATHDHQVDFEKLREPLPELAVVRLFCTGCGIYSGLNSLDANFEAFVANQKNVTSFSGLYFHSGKCAVCDSEDSSLELKEIPNV